MSLLSAALRSCTHHAHRNRHSLDPSANQPQAKGQPRVHQRGSVVLASTHLVVHNEFRDHRIVVDRDLVALNNAAFNAHIITGCGCHKVVQSAVGWQEVVVGAL